MLTAKSTQVKSTISARWLKTLSVIICLTVVILPRILPFPPTFLAPDEMKIGVWVSEMADALSVGAWEKTAITNNPYPAVTLAWLEAIQAKAVNLLPGQATTEAQMLSNTDEDVFASLPRRRLTLALLNSFIILAIFWLLQRLYHHFVAVTATILIALDPFLLTESRVLRAEGLTTGLMMLSALTIILYAKERRGRWLLVSGILAGLAALTRISAFYLFPFAGLVLLAWPLLAGERKIILLLWQTTRDLLGWGLMMGMTFVVLWPALWVSPMAGPGKLYGALQPVFTDATRVWSKGVFFQGGAMHQVDPGAAFYLWALAYRTTPIIWVGLAAALVGAMLMLKRRGEAATQNGQEGIDPASSRPRVLVSPPRFATTALILAYLVFYFIAINLSATKIDRYLIATLPGLAILAAVGFGWMMDFFSGLGQSTWLKNGGVWAVLLVGSAWFALPHHPYYYTYWNPLLGGGQTAVNILPITFRLGLDELIDHLNKLPQAQEINLAGPSLELGQECWVTFVGKCLEAKQFLAGDYFLLSRYAVQHEMTLSNIQTIILDLELVDKFTRQGVDYAWLYKMPDNLQYVGYWLDLSAGSFSGYRLSTTEVRAGDSLDVTLLWQNGEKSGWRFDDSELFVKVLDEIGQTRQIIPAQLKPEFSPYLSQPNEILVFTALLNFPADTPVGLYPIEIGLRLKATGEETLNFPLTNLARTITVKQGVLATSAQKLPIQHHLDQPIADTGLTLLGYDEPFFNSMPIKEAVQNSAEDILTKSKIQNPKSKIIYLYWRTDKPLIENYSLKLDLLSPDGRIVATWSRPIAPDIHPLTAWQPAEIIKLPFPLELGYPLPPDSYQAVLSILPANNLKATPLTTINLPHWPKDFGLARPEVNLQHSLNEITFDKNLDLLGYDLAGKNDASGGTLFVTLYWLNRQPLQPLEAEVQVLAKNGLFIAEQRLPVPSPPGLLTWQSVSHYELTLNTLPSSLTIRVRPAGAETWYQVHSPAKPSADAVIIDDILSKIVRVSN